MSMTTLWRERLASALETLAGPRVRLPEDLSPFDVQQTQHALERLLPGEVLLTGTFERRLLIAQDRAGAWWTGDLTGAPLASRGWPPWARTEIELSAPQAWWSPAAISAAGLRRLFAPRLLLVALYHPEWFPLPRFPLGISDLARAARATLTGQVRLLDMQLGVTLDDVRQQVAEWRPDIVGVSATFGQHDILTRALDFLFGLDPAPLVLAGGSLTARNEALLLADHPQLVIARGAGEPTVQDVLAYWHGDLALHQVRGIGYTHPTDRADRAATTPTPSATRRPVLRTARPATPAAPDTYPELDLLPATFAHHGVAQLEASRGCTSACSFCPRSHKGTWTPVETGLLPEVLAAMGSVFAAHPDISRTLYLVDEEFIGTRPDAAERALTVAATIHQAGLSWESSCRADQITGPTDDLGWHIDRARLFRRLCRSGLRRMLFGIESGVDTVLQRFTKQITRDQNITAIRTLSALGVPTRFTYLTFDPLMTLQELRATVAFLGRRDLLLRPRPDLDEQQIVQGVRDPGFVAAHAAERPFHTAVSYPLVSMECLIGSAYTRQVAATGLAGRPDPALGRIDTAYADWRIGRAARHGQLWVDRHFALDYTLKSLEKILPDPARHSVRQARTVLKDAAHQVLEDMLDRLESHDRHRLRPEDLDRDLVQVLDTRLEDLRPRVQDTVHTLAGLLPGPQTQLLTTQTDAWSNVRGWRLINATTDACDIG